MRLRCACAPRVCTVEFYCKECRSYRCDACVSACKTAHPDFVLDRRFLLQKGARSARALRATDQKTQVCGKASDRAGGAAQS
jgi:hypothetical protein